MAEMPRGRGTLSSSSETVDLNQGPLPSDTSMDDSASRDNISNPVGNRLLRYMHSPANGSISQTNAANDSAWTFSSWDRGESSSSKSNMHDGTCSDDSKLRLGWRNSISRPDGRSSETFNIGSSNYFSSERNRGTQNRSLNQSHLPDQDCDKDLGAILSHPLHQFNSSVTGPAEYQYASSSNVGTSPASLYTLHDNLPHAGSGNLSISSGTLNLPSAIRVERLNSNSGISASGRVPLSFPHSSVSEIPESSAGNSSIRPNHMQQGPIQYVTPPRGTSVRHFDNNAALSSRCILNSDSSEWRSPITPHVMHVNDSRMCLDSREGPSTSRGGSVPGSFIAFEERVSVAHEGGSVRSLRINNLEYPPALYVMETRNIFPHQIDWSYDPGTSSSSRSRAGRSSDGWSSRQNHQMYQNHHQLPESDSLIRLPPPRIEFVSENQRSHSTPLTSTPSLADEVGSTSQHQSQFPQGSAAILMGTPSDRVSGSPDLAADSQRLVDRQRLVRRYLMRRRNLHSQTEDNGLHNPYIDDIPELRDRHRDMRLDVDNMSYEELLALGEQIGNVSTGLSEEKIRSLMKQRRVGEAPRVSDPCCICQEVYACGNEIGILDCGHEFHTGCIKQWLMLKNLCPICKTTAFGS